MGLKPDQEQRPSAGKICTLFENVLTPEVSEMAHLMVIHHARHSVHDARNGHSSIYFTCSRQGDVNDASMAIPRSQPLVICHDTNPSPSVMTCYLSPPPPLPPHPSPSKRPPPSLTEATLLLRRISAHQFDTTLATSVDQQQQHNTTNRRETEPSTTFTMT